MEEASGMNLKDFFDQWLYKPGALQLNGTWQYDVKKKVVNITLNQVQTSGSLFKMPVQVAVTSKTGNTVMHTLQVNEKTNTFTLPAETEPNSVLLDPNTWVLMDSACDKKK
jgi:aminopeptidase N